MTEGEKWGWFCHEDDEEWPCSTVRRAEAAASPGLDADDLGLSAEQTAILREHLASRQQTVTEFIGDMLMDIGLGRATGREWPLPSAALAEPKGDAG